MEAGKDSPVYLTVEEMNSLLDQTRDVGGPIGIRDRAMLEVLYGTGIHVQELIAMNTEDVHFREKYLTAGPRALPLYDAALWALQAWVNVRGKIAEPLEAALFVNSTGTRMSRQGFWKRIKKYAEEAGIEKKVSPHTLRATFAVHMIENGAGMDAIQELLGVNYGAVAKYRNMVQARRLRDTLEGCHPQAMKERAVDGKQNVSTRLYGGNESHAGRVL